ncbi:MmpS family transport accessory protein [Nocardia sp. XZ_19_385]|uniref:MmpS family transport accessory protein n=1 Tax=Nocardia sp. XZ_19_385 TaxID=2769488 RepID=UPI0018900867|nr:MmpS family transport accessory protein [Nocardia sp. XZ_19_385]
MVGSNQRWPGQLPADTPPDRRRGTVRAGLIAGCLLTATFGLVALAVAVVAATEPAPMALVEQEPLPAVGSVSYEVTASTGSAHSVAYVSGDNLLRTEVSTPLPWKKRVTSPTLALALNAQRNGIGDITCRITVNGRTVAEQTASGLYAVVNCTAPAP